MSLLRGIQRSVLGGADAAVARGRLPPFPLSCLSGALRSRSSSLFPVFVFLFLFLLGGGAALRSSAYATAAATTDQTPPDPLPERDAQHDLVGALRSRSRFSSAYLTAAARSRFATDLSDWEICGGIDDAPGREMDPEAIELARFAVAEHNSKTNAALELVRLVNVRTQMVAGIMYYFTIEVREIDGGAGAGANKLYEAEAEVWHRSWEKFKGLQDFVVVGNADEGKTKV